MTDKIKVKVKPNSNKEKIVKNTEIVLKTSKEENKTPREAASKIAEERLGL